MFTNETLSSQIFEKLLILFFRCLIHFGFILQLTPISALNQIILTHTSFVYKIDLISGYFVGNC